MKFGIYLAWKNTIIERTEWNFKWKTKGKRECNEYKILDMKTCNKRLFEEILKETFRRFLLMKVYILYIILIKVIIFKEKNVDIIFLKDTFKRQ